MTVSAVTPRVRYVGSGSTGPFSIPFYWLNSGELLVTKTDDEGVETTLVVTTNFTLTGAGTDSGSLTLLVALAVGETLVIERTTTQTQAVDLQRSYLDYEILESSLDKVTRGIQDLWWRTGRALSLYKDDTSGSGTFNAGGNKIGNVAEGVEDDDVAIMSQLNEIAGSADAAAASAVAAAASAAIAQGYAGEIGDAISGSVVSFEGRTGAVAATAGDYTASEVTNVPSGNLAAVTVQNALNELQTELDGKQTTDAELTALAGLTSAANKLPYFTGSGTAALADLSAYARTLIDDANAAAARTTLELVPGTHVQAYNANLADYASDATAFIQTLIDDVDAATARSTLGLGSAAVSDTSAFQSADGTLSGLAAYNTNGLLTQTTADTFVGRSVAAGSGISITNGDGVAGNPTVAVDINGLTNRTAFESGDKLMIYEAGVGLRKIDYDDLPVGGGSGSGGGGLANAYKDITDGSNSASASGADEIKFRAGTGLSVTVGSNDVTHGDNVLYELDATLAALAGVTVAADKLIYATGADAFAATDLTSFARTILDDADAAAVQTTLGLVPGVNVQAYDAELATLAGLTSAADRLPYFTGSGTADLAVFTAFARTILDDADASAARTTLGLVIGTNVQAYDADLASWAGVTRAAGYDTFAATPSSANLRSLLTDESGTGAAYFQGGALGTPSGGTLTNCDGLPVAGISPSTSSSLGVGSLELGHASDTTLSRSASGRLAVEGKDALLKGQTDALTAGYSATPYNAGTKSSGTYTPDEANGNLQYATNGGAHTLAPPTNSGTLIILYANNGSAGAITTSGFTKVTGDSFNTTDGNEFMCYLTKHSNGTGFSHLHVTALQ